MNCVLKECGIESEDQKFDIASSDFYLSSLRSERLGDMIDVIKRCIKHTGKVSLINCVTLYVCTNLILQRYRTSIAYSTLIIPILPDFVIKVGKMQLEAFVTPIANI